ncbi:MAG: YdcF family protein [Clostridiales bacterium]|nr:YdcF family protein [Candidatus Equinaster intestinalis]
MLFTVFGIVFFIWFMIPVFSYGRINVGNTTGIIISVILFIIGITQKKFFALIKELWAKGAGKLLISAVCLILAAILIIAAVETVFMIKAQNKKPDENATLVVLGCKVTGEKPSLMLRARITAAKEYLEQNPNAKCVLSGGKGEDEGISEAVCMFNELTAMGIDKSRLYLEDKSTSTRENLAFSLEVIKENGLNDSIAIVTNNFHCYRASRVADSLGIENGSVPADTLIFFFPTYYVRELYGILYEWVF